VACHAVRQTLNLVFLNQVRSQLQLVVRVLVGDVENLIPRPDILRRIAVTLNAPLHVKRIDFIHQRHPVNSAVTGRAADAFIHVNAVVKVDKVRQIVDPRPLERLPSAEAGADWLQQLRVRPNLRMTAHARLSWGEASEGGSLDRSVAVAAVNAVVANVVLVAKRNRLLAGHIHIGDKRSCVDFVSRPNGSGQQQHDAYNADFCQAVRAAVKDLCHAQPSLINIGFGRLYGANSDVGREEHGYCGQTQQL
jgi:hypothetical protein